MKISSNNSPGIADIRAFSQTALANLSQAQSSPEQHSQTAKDKLLASAAQSGMAQSAVDLGLRFVERGHGEANFLQRPTEATGRPEGDQRSAEQILDDNPVLARLGDQKDIKRDLLKQQCGDWTQANSDPAARADAAYNLARVLNYIDSSTNREGGERANAADNDIQGITSDGDARHGTEAGMLKDFAEQGYDSLPHDRKLDLTNDSHVRIDGSNMDNFQWGAGQAGNILEKLPIAGHIIGEPLVQMSKGGDALDVISRGLTSLQEGTTTVASAAAAGPYGVLALGAADSINTGVEALTGRESNLGNTLVDTFTTFAGLSGFDQSLNDSLGTFTGSAGDGSASSGWQTALDILDTGQSTLDMLAPFFPANQRRDAIATPSDNDDAMANAAKLSTDIYTRPEAPNGRPAGDLRTAEQIIAQNPVLANLGDQKDIQRDLLKQQCGDWTANNSDPTARADAAYNLAAVLNYIDTTLSQAGLVRGDSGDGDIHGITADGDARHGTEAGMLKDFAEQGYTSLPRDAKLPQSADPQVSDSGRNQDNFQYGASTIGQGFENIPLLNHIIGQPLTAMGQGENAEDVLQNGIEAFTEGLQTVGPALSGDTGALTDLLVADTIDIGLTQLSGEKQNVGADWVELFHSLNDENKLEDSANDNGSSDTSERYSA